mgnify:CR=1 FL=1
MGSKRLYISKENDWSKYIENDYKSSRRLSIDVVKNGIILPARYFGTPVGVMKGECVMKNLIMLQELNVRKEHPKLFQDFLEWQDLIWLIIPKLYI